MLAVERDVVDEYVGGNVGDDVGENNLRQREGGDLLVGWMKGVAIGCRECPSG